MKRNNGNYTAQLVAAVLLMFCVVLAQTQEPANAKKWKTLCPCQTQFGGVIVIDPGGAPQDWAITPKDMLVIKLAFSGAPLTGENGNPFTDTAIRKVFTDASDLIRKMSYGKTWIDNLTITSEIFTLPGSLTYYVDVLAKGYLDLEDDARMLAQNAGHDVEAFDILVYLFPEAWNDWAGRASLRGPNLWLNGTIDRRVVVHELGHNYGIWHASGWETQDGSIMGMSGQTNNDGLPVEHVEYGDYTDIMGSGPYPEGWFHPQALMRLGWIDDSQVINVSSDGTYRIFRFDHPSMVGKQSLALQIADANEPFWIGYRRGLDVSFPRLQSSAYLLWQYDDRSSRLLNTNPRLDDRATLDLGRTFTDPTGTVHITPIDYGGSAPDYYLDVAVRLGQTGSQDPVVGNLKIPTQINARQPVSFSMTAIDPDGDELFGFWDFGENVLPVAGLAATTIFDFGGEHQIEARVTDLKGGSTHIGQTIMVDDPLLNWTTTETEAAWRSNIQFVNDRFMVVGNERVGQSTNGIEWVWNEIPNLKGQSSTGNGKTFVVAGFKLVTVEGELSSRGAAWSSPDGITWTQEDVPPDAGSLNAVAFGKGTFVAVGEGGTIATRAAESFEWSLQQVVSETARLEQVAFGDNTFIIVGIDFPRTIVLTSSDAQTWQQLPEESLEGGWVENVTYGAGRFVMAGSGIFTSKDRGRTWQKWDSPFLQESLGAYGEGIYFVAKNSFEDTPDGSFQDKFLPFASRDGLRWTALPQFDIPDYIRHLTYGNGRFVGITFFGTIIQSGLITPQLQNDVVFLSVEMPETNRIVLQYQGNPGATYAVESTSNFSSWTLVDSSMQVVSDIPATVELSLDRNVGQEFFRVVEIE